MHVTSYLQSTVPTVIAGFYILALSNVLYVVYITVTAYFKYIDTLIS